MKDSAPLTSPADSGMAAGPGPVPGPQDTAGDNAATLRRALVDELVRQHRLTDPRVEAAFRRVPRHAFLPGIPLERAHADDAVVTRRNDTGGASSSVSAPWLQAAMLQAAELRPGQTVVEIGSGGYQAALMQELVGPHGTVVTIDIDPFVVDRARSLLPAAGYGDVAVVLGDAELGVPAGLLPAAGADAVVVTVEARDIPPAWVDQLAEGGRLVVPLRIHGYTWAVALHKRGGRLEGRSYEVCGFVPLQGAGRREDTVVALRGGEVRLRFADGGPADVRGLERALGLPRGEVWTGITVPGDQPFDLLCLLLATTLDGFCRLAVDPALDTGAVTRPNGWDAAAVVRDGSLARLATRKLRAGGAGGASLWEFGVHAYGPRGGELARTMADMVTIWDRRLRGGSYPLLTVHPADTPDDTSDAAGATAAAAADAITRSLVLKRHTRLVFDWPFPPGEHPSARDV
ncbi:methyltransferase, FxLD system [Kitasatospora sp. NPDC059571]|uniref:methyltransferase, FxLD system n=1 Tax=Kitasatospora sp. NPDC059571 TaxID=3346871 RepID=UPI0036C866C4